MNWSELGRFGEVVKVGESNFSYALIGISVELGLRRSEYRRSDKTRGARMWSFTKVVNAITLTLET